MARRCSWKGAYRGDDADSFGAIARGKLRSVARYLEIAERLEDLLRELPTDPLYSDDLAHRRRTSARTLQVASQVVHGMSLHAYIRLTRLRSAHTRLKSGSVNQTVKDALSATVSGAWVISPGCISARSANCRPRRLPGQELAKAQMRRRRSVRGSRSEVSWATPPRADRWTKKSAQQRRVLLA